MTLHERAGQTAQASDLTNIPRLVSEYYTNQPSPEHAEELVSFGTSGHRGCSFKNTFNDVHIAAICQAISEYRHQQSITGPLYIGIDTHALSECAFITAIEVFVANGVSVVVQEGRGYTPTPVISNAILTYNLGRDSGLADGVVITPSHNPPQDGGFKYNPPNGGPADSDVTNVVQARANEIIVQKSTAVKRINFNQAKSSLTEYDFVKPYVDGLGDVLNMKAIADSGLKIGVDPLGGSGIAYWDVIAETYGLNIHKVNSIVDPSFSFMSLDKDGQIRMDCSSPYAMTSLIRMKDQFDISVGNDPDYDRHGIVTKSAGLMNPNHYLSVAINYLFQNRPDWSKTAAIGKTLVSSSMIDRVAKSLGRELKEVPVGFKWFVDGIHNGSFGFGGEESAGASFLKKNGQAWSTDKDGIIMALLAAEITAVTERDPAQHYAQLTRQFGSPIYKRTEATASLAQKNVLKNLSAKDVEASTLAGEPIIKKLTTAPGNGAAIGGLKVITDNGWFAARPSGTEDIYKIYCESFLGDEHIRQLTSEAQEIVNQTFKKAGL